MENKINLSLKITL